MWSLSSAVELPTDSLGVMIGCPVPLHFFNIHQIRVLWSKSGHLYHWHTHLVCLSSSDGSLSDQTKSALVSSSSGSNFSFISINWSNVGVCVALAPSTSGKKIVRKPNRLSKTQITTNFSGLYSHRKIFHSLLMPHSATNHPINTFDRFLSSFNQEKLSFASYQKIHTENRHDFQDVLVFFFRDKHINQSGCVVVYDRAELLLLVLLQILHQFSFSFLQCM